MGGLFILDSAALAPSAAIQSTMVAKRLAVDLRGQGRGLGETLLLDAIHRVVRAGDTIGIYAIVVDALHDRASAFYERYGFTPFPSEPLRLFLPLRTFEQLGLSRS